MSGPALGAVLSGLERWSCLAVAAEVLVEMVVQLEVVKGRCGRELLLLLIVAF